MEREERLSRRREQYIARGNRETIEERERGSWLEVKRASERRQHSTM